MELLHHCGYELNLDVMRDDRFHEIKMRIESIIELCRDGEISVYEARPIIVDEYIYSMEYRNDLFEKLEKLDLLDDLEPLDGDFGDVASVSIGSGKQQIDIDIIDWEWDKKHRDARRPIYQKALKDLEDIYKVTQEALDFLWTLLDNNEYQQKRKEKIKSQIIKDGLILLQKKIDTTETSIDILKNEHDVSEKNEGTLTLFTLYPEFKKDYQLLFNNKYLEIRENGLLWKKSIVSLSEYFRSIKPTKMKRIIWKTIETIFDVENLKRNVDKPSKDFINWQKIKNTPVSK